MDHWIAISLVTLSRTVISQKLGDIYLLGCQCGEVGCWPLTTRVTVNNNRVLWDSFRQPHRERDYSRFGPFVFDLDQYRNAVALLATTSVSELLGVGSQLLINPIALIDSAYAIPVSNCLRISGSLP
jgi:hypothetical protein